MYAVLKRWFNYSMIYSYFRWRDDDGRSNNLYKVWTIFVRSRSRLVQSSIYCLWKCNILDMRICNRDRNSFVILKPSLHDWLTNKSKSCKDSIQDNYNDNYVNWSLRNLLSVILSIYINLNCFIRNRLTDRLFFQNRQLFDLKSILYNSINLFLTVDINHMFFKFLSKSWFSHVTDSVLFSDHNTLFFFLFVFIFAWLLSMLRWIVIRFLSSFC